MKILLPLLFVVVIAAAVLIALAMARHETNARTNRRECARHEAFLDFLHKEAISNRDVEPYAAVMADEIRNHLSNTPVKRNR